MIVCLRVDERLIHGQVAMTWTKELKLNGLVVASDEAASNELQKMTLKMAVPEGIKCIIKSVEDVTTILDESTFRVYASDGTCTDGENMSYIV